MINEAATIENAKYHAEQAGIQKGIQVSMEAIAKKMIGVNKLNGGRNSIVATRCKVNIKSSNN
ncbi:hypothetical protein FCT18_04500 [Lysinibacillus sphaericus]|uniref:Uncharacterized protein n=1 Tax=Lysinibacillus sphaericus TaxID=1421 RepID=A0A2S0K0J0_LYSSH|nr:hypothetical protein [Lysinibacillus sphaericus]AVK96856.1 hypothetical protein LS41612_11595 [Lysinibacillus sphaericus]MED4546203.1 hypothetical protein [Lysinibacillus sphaericus]TKI20603.1 hypothetical protein FCT18_04500 [Lysinibacillus sphaericus]SUV17308.1 Uncharacterised protein [Lysinibacillus sphaericus]GEC84411.1 hypothetical protein LSP03_41540 [Lysinibacillus sphaericus]